MEIAVVGSGVSGLVAAYRLAERHRVTLFEAEPRLGGHTHTVDVATNGGTLPVDTGFLVYNERTYPLFTRLLAEWGVESQPSDMSFSLQCEHSGLEYCGSSLFALFAQPSNLLRPSFLRMLADILRFNRRAPRLLADLDEHVTLGQLLDRLGYGRAFSEQYLLPMCAAIWSAPADRMRAFPAVSLLRFFANHGLVSLRDRPQWRTIRGGARTYIEAILRRRPLIVRQAAPVTSVRRAADHVRVQVAGAAALRFDRVFIATHADDALRLLADPSRREIEILSAFSYQPNHAVLHTDTRRLPSRRRAWASWNYFQPAQPHQQVSVTYWLNRLQNIAGPTQYLVTLNDPRPFDPATVLRRIDYSHPVFTAAAVAAQRRHGEISGQRLTYYCGAHWGYGFHEDGARSGIAAYEQFQREQPAPCTVASTPG